MNELPASIERGAAALTFFLGVGLVAAHTYLATRAAARTTLEARARALAPLGVGAFGAAWLAIAFVTGDGAHFPVAGDGTAARLPTIGAVSFLPLLVAVAMVYGSRTLRELNTATAPDWLIRLQTYRVAGLLFFFPYLYFGILPAGFAVPALVGDVLTGVAAPFVAAQVARRGAAAHPLALAWNLFGMADLLVAPVAAALSHSNVLFLYPLNLVPLFMGPPVGLLTHVLSLRNLAATRAAAVADGALVTQRA